MKIHKFDREKGLYKFELAEVKTKFHAHPAVEIVFSANGGIEVETSKSKFKNTSFAVIDSNITHKMTSKKDDMILLMIECNTHYLQKILSDFEINLSEGIYIESCKTNREKIIEEISHLYNKSKFPITTEKRIQECLKYLNSTSSEYKEMVKVLKLKTNLSESRLSHLFKQEIGISIKKYLVWSKLKKAFEGVVSRNTNMYEISFESGFYDQAHLSKAFKQMLGINPSEVYNSRMLQV